MVYSVGMLVYHRQQFLERGAATMDIEDRAALFSDGVYEVVRYYAGRPLRMDAHVQRFIDSATGIDQPVTDEVQRVAALSDELVRRNNVPDALVYWQASRGTPAGAPRKHVYPPDAPVNLLLTTTPAQAERAGTAVRTAKVILTPDDRWLHCCYKTLMLLPNVLAKTRAARAGADEAVFVRDGVVTEGASTSVLVVRDDVLHTHPLNGRILPGVTRAVCLDVAKAAGLRVVEMPYPVAGLAAADEVILTGTGSQVAAVTHVDGVAVADGAAGPVAQKLWEGLLGEALR